MIYKKKSDNFRVSILERKKTSCEIKYFEETNHRNDYWFLSQPNRRMNPATMKH